MAGLKTKAEWSKEVYQIETTDPVMGGENGVTNKPAKDLGNRTEYLKKEQDKLKEAISSAKSFSSTQVANLEKKSFIDRGALGGKDLNTVFEPGRYAQRGGPYSLYVGLNYPAPQAGELLVSKWGSGNNVVHVYITIYGDIFIRFYHEAIKEWYSWQDNAAKSTHQIELYYDNALHSQSSLNVKQDLADITKSDWVILPASETNGVRSYIEPLKTTKVYTSRCYSNEPGYYQSPKYSEDKSRTWMQFVIANDTATSAQINAELDRLNIEPPACGGWWDGARVYDAIALRFNELHPYSRLWVRFINKRASKVSADDYFKQSVITHGGNPSVQVDRVVQYPKLLQLLDQFKK